MIESRRRCCNCVDNLHQQSSLDVYGFGKFGVCNVPQAEVIACDEQTLWINTSEPKKKKKEQFKISCIIFI